MALAPSDDGHLAGQERRTAADGHLYTLQEFIDHYGEGTATAKWDTATEERRKADDGRLYTFQEFLAHFGEGTATAKWDAASDDGHLAGAGGADGAAHDGAAPPPAAVNPPPPPPAAVNALLTPRTAANLRASTNIATTCKKDMRAYLDQVSASQPRDPWQMVWNIPDDVEWRHYIARHPECQRIVGTGIVRAELEFLPHIRDPKRGGQLRLDYVFENRERVRCQLHPGNKAKDALPIFTDV